MLMESLSTVNRLLIDFLIWHPEAAYNRNFSQFHWHDPRTEDSRWPIDYWWHLSRIDDVSTSTGRSSRMTGVWR